MSNFYNLKILVDRGAIAYRQALQDEQQNEDLEREIERAIANRMAKRSQRLAAVTELALIAESLV